MLQFICLLGGFVVTNKYCHLTYEDRILIERELNDGNSIKKISILINKDYSTISREISRNKVFKGTSGWNGYTEPCKKKNNCDKKFCDFKQACYVKDMCHTLTKSPYVCNNCHKRHGCRRERYTYYAKQAHDKYLELLSESRKGIDLTPEQIYQINKVIYPLMRDKRQTVNHLYINHPELLDFSKTSFYTYTNMGLFDFDNMDLPRKIRYKKRKSKKRRTSAERLIRKGRTYENFKEYIERHPNCNIVEMDTVEGRKGGKVFLTLLWRKYNFMLIYLMKQQTMECVNEVFELLQETLLGEDYEKMFEVILTDNGSEFFNPLSIERCHRTDEKISNLFYCDPGASYQKGTLEKNHEFIRYVLPKKSSFDDLTQDKCYMLASHINSLCREELNGQCPFKATLFMVDEWVLNSLNIYYIEPDEVTLKKSLLK